MNYFSKCFNFSESQIQVSFLTGHSHRPEKKNGNCFVFYVCFSFFDKKEELKKDTINIVSFKILTSCCVTSILFLHHTVNITKKILVSFEAHHSNRF